MSGIRVTPEQLAAMSGRVSSGATSIEGELQSLAAALAPLGSDWAGVAQQRFEALWAEWQRSARGLHEALTGVSALLSQAGSHYAEAERAIASLDMSYVKPVSPDLAHLIARQDGLATVEQLAAHGFDPSAVYRRIKAGRWRRLLPSVVLSSSGPPSRRQLLIASALWGGSGAVIDGPDACAWYGIKPTTFDPRRVHIVVPRESPARSHGFVVVRRTLAEIRVGHAGLLHYVDPATALLVSARGAKSVATAIDVLSRGLQTALVTAEQLLEARRSIGDKWCRGLDSALLAVGVGLRSPAEKTNHDLIVTSRILPVPRWNQWLDLGDGLSEVCADALWDDAGMVEEVLGKRWHSWGQQFENTEVRRARLVAVGLVPQGVTPLQLRRGRAEVLERLERTYVLNKGRGMPPGVRLIDPPTWAMAG